MLGKFSCFCYRLQPQFIGIQNAFSKISFRKTIRMSNGLDRDQDGHSVGPDLFAKVQQMKKVAASN